MTKSFPHDKGLTTRTAIFVPSTKHGNQKISKKEFNARVSETQNFLNKEFGGTTSVRAVGAYTIKGKKDKLIKEDVVVVENFSTPADYKKHQKAVEKFTENKQKVWTQDSIGFELQQPKKPLSLHFVKAHKKKGLKDIT